MNAKREKQLTELKKYAMERADELVALHAYQSSQLQFLADELVNGPEDKDKYEEYMTLYHQANMTEAELNRLESILRN